MENFSKFSRWLIKQADRGDPVGDLGLDYAEDFKSRRTRGDEPISSLRQLRHLVNRGGGSAGEDDLAEALLEFLTSPP